MSRKREKPYLSRYDRAPLPKRRRSVPPSKSSTTDEAGDKATAKPQPASAVVVMGLSSGCSVLELKSRFEIYGAISRIRIEHDGVGFIAYRSKESAEAAITAALDTSFGITFDSKKVRVLWATDPLAQWREGVGVGGNKDNGNESSSKLLRAEVPLSRYGRGNKLASAIVNPRSSTEDSTESDGPFRGRDIVSYDDIL